MNNGHLSASQRRILDLERQLEIMKRMQVEYNVLLNYIVCYHPNTGQDAFIIKTDELRKMEVLTIRTEISKDGKQMTITRVPAAPQPDAPRIIVP